MKRTSIITLLFICAFAALIFVLNNMALAEYFYWKFWWYDIMMHGFGGLLIGSSVTWALVRFGISHKLSYKGFFGLAMLLVLVVGVGWEIMEYTNDFFIGEANVIGDTILDIIMDLTGGALGWFLVSRTLKHSSEPIQTI